MKTIISNVIRIEDPTPEIREYAKTQLELPNPEYVKKERMGFWLGRTPKTLRLYEWHGGDLILPFGLVREILPLLQAGDIRGMFVPGEDVDYGQPIPLYDYQRDAVTALIRKTYGILKSPAGSGKTQTALAYIQAVGKKALWLCHTADLLHQSKERAELYMQKSLMGTITEGKVNIGTGITFATVQTMCNVDLPRYRNEWDIIVVDECFPCDTEIMTPDGTKQIAAVKPGDEVLAIKKSGKIIKQKVKKIFKRKPEAIVKVFLNNGESIACTPNHPFLTQRGYVDARHLTNLDSVYHLWETGRHINAESAEAKQHFMQKEESVLLSRMREECQERMDGRETRKIKTTDDCSQQENSFVQNEGKQPNEKSGNQGTAEENSKENTSKANCPWREREWPYGNAETNVESFKNGPASTGICHKNKSSTRKWISDMLQSGSCLSGKDGRHRNRWKLSFFNRKTTTGPEEGRVFEWVRVDRVEVQQQTSDGTYGGLCKDGFVYNLHVRRNHNYFANGLNVHNCHRVSQSATSVSRYQKVLNNLAARHKIGLTATPERSDGLIRATFALIGEIVHEVPDEAVKGKIMPVTVIPVQTESVITDDCLNVDGTICYTGLINHLCSDPERTRLIASCIQENAGHSCLILSDRISHLEAIRDALPEEMRRESALITGKMTSKADKAYRQQAIEDMRENRLKYLFASYNLSKEGLDIQRLDRLFLASPVKFSAVVIQSVGRIQRTFPGKDTPVCYDFVDKNIGFCMRAFRERKKHYKKGGATIEVPLNESHKDP